MEAYIRGRLEEKEEEIARLVLDLQRQEEQIENLCQALARARAGNRYGREDGPFAKYRQLAFARRRWRIF
jgi:predicted RNase H-like nuclease (RuvC/YqgF family)